MLEPACMYVYPKTIARYYGTLYYTSLRSVHKSTTVNRTIRSGGGSPSLLFVAVIPAPQRGVRPSIVLSYRYRLSFYRYRYRIIEKNPIRYYRFFVERYHREFDTISNANLSPPDCFSSGPVTSSSTAARGSSFRTYRISLSYYHAPRDVMSKWIFENMPVVNTPKTAATPRRHPIPRDCATAPIPTHTAALAIPGGRTGVTAKLGERRFLRVKKNNAHTETASNH